MSNYTQGLLGIIIDPTLLANVSALLVISLSDIESILKILVGITTLVWTIFKIIVEIKKYKKDRNDKKDKLSD